MGKPVGVRVPPSAPVEIHRRSEDLGAFSLSTGALQGLEREPAADRIGRESPTLGGRQAGEPAGRAKANPPDPHRPSPPFGTIAILKGNLASRQVPFFRFYGLSG